MPTAALRPCTTQGCPALVVSGRCPAHTPADNRSEAARGWHKLYNRQWQRYRIAFLSRNPICSDPYKVHGKYGAAASVVDHKEAHRGDYELFWRESNHAALCTSCNSRKAASSEGGFGNPRAAG